MLSKASAGPRQEPETGGAFSCLRVPMFRVDHLVVDRVESAPADTGRIDLRQVWMTPFRPSPIWT